MEKHTVREITFSYLHLGQNRVRVPLGHFDKELRELLHKATSQASCTTGKTTLEKNGDLICRMIPKQKGEFQKLLRKVFNLMAKKIERYLKKNSRQRVKAGGTQRHSSRNKKGVGYRNRKALTT